MWRTFFIASYVDTIQKTKKTYPINIKLFIISLFVICHIIIYQFSQLQLSSRTAQCSIVQMQFVGVNG